MAVRAGYAGGGSPTRRAAQPSCTPALEPGERWGDRHNRPKGLALTAWGAAPSSNGGKASRQADQSRRRQISAPRLLPAPTVPREGQSPDGRDFRLGEASAEYGPTGFARHAASTSFKPAADRCRRTLFVLFQARSARLAVNQQAARSIPPAQSPGSRVACSPRGD
jgi:hypothetical protein